MGMSPGNESMWVSLSSDREARSRGAPSSFEAQLTPWWGPPSELTYRNNEIALGMGYDILRLQGMKSRLVVDGEEMQGTAYFQKVTVQAPSVPWFWGMVHFDDGSYLDWFMPHLTPLSTTKDDKPWRKRDAVRIPLKRAGIFHDRKRGMTHEFDNCEVEVRNPIRVLRILTESYFQTSELRFGTTLLRSQWKSGQLVELGGHSTNQLEWA